ncbi:MAG TPA: GMC family oxidoreductase [Gammaproteobacteria bacterium]|nr:GMC family oxidoreductase [Gammaproteobacteria bacterium]
MHVYGPEDITDDIRCDYLIVGSGAGASVASLELARQGYDVVVIEEGRHHPTESFGPGIGRQTAELYRNGGITPILGKPSIAFAEGRCIGGTTVINGGLIWRTPSWIFHEWEQEYGLQSFSQVSLERHFESVEKNLYVAPTEIIENSGNLDSIRLHEGAMQLGWKSVVVPRAVRGCKSSNLCPTGCPTGAKQSVDQTYIPTAIAHGARLYSECKALKIEHSSNKVTGILVRVGNTGNRIIRFKCDHLILGAGAIQSPHLLRRSKLISKGAAFQFHLNLKFVVEFSTPVEAENGTIFTTQMQEFARDGMLLTAANIKPAYVALSFSTRSAKEIESVLSRYDHLAICTAMIRPKGTGRINSSLGQQPLLWSTLDKSDDQLIREACLRSIKVFFAAKAKKVYLPLAGTPCVTSFSQAEKLLAGTRAKDFELVSVHVMSSLPMASRDRRNLVDETGKLANCKNLHIMDASILPSNIGESPQGTIMAFAHELSERYIDNH